MKTFGDKVMQFNKELEFSGKLPPGIKIMNPFKENKPILKIAGLFYKKFYNDTRKRKFIIGINPGRLGAGATGIPFTDTKRLSDICGIKINSFATHEPSSVFIYDVIEKLGGAINFYNNFYINSLCPLGFIRKSEREHWVNCNYYDYPELFDAMRNFILKNLKRQIGFGLDTTTCFILGKKNAKYFKLLNEREKLFDRMLVFDHPRYIEQYRSKERAAYINDYISRLSL